MTAKEFSEKIGKHRGYVSQVMRGHIFPGKKLIEIIQEATGYAIRRSDFVRCKNKTQKELDRQQKQENEH